MAISLIQSDYDVLDYEAGVDDNIRGQECCACFRLLKWNFYDRNSSRKNGYDAMCSLCKSAPKLSIAEHTSRLREMNFNSEGTRRQRHADQNELRQDRGGRSMDASLFLQKLRHIYPALYVTQGGIVGDLALYATAGTAQANWGGQTFRYLGYVTLGVMPEFSKYEFDEQRDILLRCKEMGWRSVLLRFIEANVLSEEQCTREFGPPSGGENSLWFKKLHNHRNSKKI